MIFSALQAQLTWKDHQPRSVQFNDIYFTRDALAEIEHVFIRPNDLRERWCSLGARSFFTIGELGFGTGLNFLVTVKAWLEAGAQGQLHYVSFEQFPLSPQDMQHALSAWPQLAALASELIAALPCTALGQHRLILCDGKVRLTLILGDANQTLLEADGHMDAWYFDGFAPSKNPEMWTKALFEQVARLSREGTSFATFTAAGAIRRTLIDVGFVVKKSVGFAQKREQLSGSFLTEKKSLGTASSPLKVAIIGAGVAGCSTAFVLRQYGFDVQVFESTALASGASGNYFALNQPSPSHAWGLGDQFYSSGFWLSRQVAQLLSTTEPVWFETGVAQLASTPRLLQKYNKLQQRSFLHEELQFLMPERLTDLIGKPVKVPGWYFPKAGLISATALCERLLSDTPLIIDPIRALEIYQNRWRLQGDKNYDADCVILANGMNANALLSQPLPIVGRPGQVSILPCQNTFVPPKITVCSQGYITPEVNGKILCGATYRHDCTSADYTEVRAEDDRANIQRWHSIFPDINTLDVAAVKGRCSVRCTRDSKLPLITQLSGKNQPLLLTHLAHGSKGFRGALLGAEYLVSQMTGSFSPISTSVAQALLEQ